MVTGMVALGGWVVSAIGGMSIAGATVAGGIGIVGTIGAGIIGGAIIGAAIGGLTAAITGGSIGKGILFGAIGGAVTGGIGAWASGLGSGAQAGATAAAQSSNLAQGTASPAILEAAAASGVTPATEVIVQGGQVVGQAAGGMSTGMGMLGSAAIQGVGSMLSGSAEEDMAEQQMISEHAEAQRQRELQERLSQMANETSLAQAGMAAESSKYGHDINYKIASEDRKEMQRQYDTGVQLDAEKLARQQGAVTNAKAAREGMMTGEMIAAPSIDEQLMQQEQQMAA